VAFGVLNATAMYGQPAIAGGRLFVSDNAVVTPNAVSGCVYWSFRPAPPSAPRSAWDHHGAIVRYAAYFGTSTAPVRRERGHGCSSGNSRPIRIRWPALPERPSCIAGG
jgi:hypothetical protein